MHFDALTLAAVADELNETLRGGRVQQVVLPDAHSIALEVYANRQRVYLLLSAHPQASRVHQVEQKPRRGVEKETPLLLLLRKYVRGSRLDSVETPIPFERVLFLRFDHPQHGPTTLVAEPMGRLSNLMLLDAGERILDALRRTHPKEAALRPVRPKLLYAPPPPQDKLPPLLDDAAVQELAQALSVDERLWRVLVQRVAGVSPTLAREVAWRAAGAADAPAADADPAQVRAVLAELWSLPETHAWTPGLLLDDEEGVVGFAAYEAHFSDEFLPVASISQAVAQFYGVAQRDAAGSTDPYAGMRNGVAALLDRAEERVRRQLAALAADEPEPGEPERLRTQAEWLLALSSQIQPGQ
ncbi:MAG: hypothetical protein D6790_19385, partial [Caldilineae bacterium]